MRVTKISQLSGIEHTIDIDITLNELAEIENRFNTKKLIQNIVPNLTMNEREFLMTGITEEEWSNTFGEE
jgi:hypothetical protein